MNRYYSNLIEGHEHIRSTSSAPSTIARNVAAPEEARGTPAPHPTDEHSIVPATSTIDTRVQEPT
jgi:hypothetical protein